LTHRIEEIASEIVRLQGELDREIEDRRKVLGVKLAAGLVGFEEGVVAQQRILRLKVSHFLAQSSFGTVVTAPVIYSLIVPLVLLDIWVGLYQAICFRVYGIPRVRRADYILFDRQHLAYLNWIEALNCMFCAYGNGVVAYVREVSSLTEQYWCPIKHALKVHDPHQRYYQFLEYGDADGYRARLDTLRRQLAADPD
jgi:hypothetical protein